MDIDPTWIAVCCRNAKVAGEKTILVSIIREDPAPTRGSKIKIAPGLFGKVKSIKRVKNGDRIVTVRIDLRKTVTWLTDRGYL